MKVYLIGTHNSKAEKTKADIETLGHEIVEQEYDPNCKLSVNIRYELEALDECNAVVAFANGAGRFEIGELYLLVLAEQLGKQVITIGEQRNGSYTG